METFEQVRDRLRLAEVRGMFLTDEEIIHLDHEIDEVLASIATCPSINNADDKLQQLGLMQEILATIWFKYRVKLSEKQRRLVQRYDRWDDFELRRASFESIKKGLFP